MSRCAGNGRKPISPRPSRAIDFHRLHLIPPEVLKPIGCQRRIARRILNIAVPHANVRMRTAVRHRYWCVRRLQELTRRRQLSASWPLLSRVSMEAPGCFGARAPVATPAGAATLFVLLVADDDAICIAVLTLAKPFRAGPPRRWPTMTYMIW